jgi:uncharacterized protein YuzE
MHKNTDMDSSPILICDPDVKALYIQLTDSEVLETVELAEGVYLDLDADGQAVGFEVLNADENLLSSIPALPDTATLKDLLSSRAA